MSNNITPYPDAQMNTQMELAELKVMIAALTIEVQNIGRLLVEQQRNNKSDESESSDEEPEKPKYDPWLDHSIRPFKKSVHLTGTPKNDFFKACNDDPDFFDTFYIPSIGARYPGINVDTFKMLTNDILGYLEEHDDGMYQNLISRLERINPVAKYN